MEALEELQKLSDQIREEEMSFLVERMVNAQAGKGSVDAWAETERGQCASMLLHILRLHRCMELIRQGRRECVPEFQKDWEAILESLKFMECRWEVTSEVLGDAVDLALLPDPGKRRDLLRLLGFAARMKIRQQKPLRRPVLDCAYRMAVYCLKTDRSDEVLRIAEHLIALSEERNGSAPDLHRAITTEWLSYIVDMDRMLIVRICDGQRKYYREAVSRDAYRFHWFYGVSLLEQEREAEALAALERCRALCMELEGERSWIGARARTSCLRSLMRSAMNASPSSAEMPKRNAIRVLVKWTPISSGKRRWTLRAERSSRSILRMHWLVMKPSLS